jgi:hypothetical protein
MRASNLTKSTRGTRTAAADRFLANLDQKVPRIGAAEPDIPPAGGDVAVQERFPGSGGHDRDSRPLTAYCVKLS